MKKKVLFIINYFYPEVVSTAQLYTDLCESMTDDFDVTVICAVPCYSGKIDEKYKEKRLHFDEYKGIKIIRVRVFEFEKTNKLSRIKHILSYFVNSVFAVFKAEKPDVVFTCSQPPILGGILGVTAKFLTRSKLIYNIQDFNPEQTEAVGYSKNKLILKAAKTFDKISCKKSDMVITVGRDMQETLKKRFEGRKVPNNMVISNWINEKEVYPLTHDDPDVSAFRKMYGLDGKFVIMYSGNIGLFYDLSNIIKVIGRFKDKSDVVFAFVGDGATKEELCSYVNDNGIENVLFIPYQDKERLVYSLNSADVHFVLNAKGIKGVSVPSKIYGVLATNKPVFGVLEQGSEAWKIIEESGCGVLCNAGDYDDIYEKLKYVLENREEFLKNHSTGYDYMSERFTKDKSINMYIDTIKNI